MNGHDTFTIDLITKVMNGVDEVFVTTSDTHVICDLYRSRVIYSQGELTMECNSKLVTHLSEKGDLLTGV